MAAHIRKITGAELPIVDTKAPEARDAHTIRILVGESDLTRKYGFKSTDFASQEQGIFFRDRDLLILGRDTDERGEDTYEKDGLWPGATLFSPRGFGSRTRARRKPTPSPGRSRTRPPGITA